jgi:hypothetical protein
LGACGMDLFNLARLHCMTFLLVHLPSFFLSQRGFSSFLDLECLQCKSIL